MNAKIETEEVSAVIGVSDFDTLAIARLANEFYGLTHVPAPAKTDKAARKFCILSALRTLSEMRHLIASRGF